MAWLALALERAAQLSASSEPRALAKLTDQLVNAWVPEDGGGIPWRKQDQFFNAPANGPAGILLARYGGRAQRAEQIADWIDHTLIDPETHLVFDGIKAGSLVRAAVHLLPGRGARAGRRSWRRAPEPKSGRHGVRVHRLVAAVAEHDGALRGCCAAPVAATADLFAGITARYLALVATTLPGESADDAVARDTARTIVLASAKSAWDYRQTVNGLPLFGAFWDRDAELPRPAGSGRNSSRAR